MVFGGLNNTETETEPDPEPEPPVNEEPNASIDEEPNALIDEEPIEPELPSNDLIDGDNPTTEPIESEPPVTETPDNEDSNPNDDNNSINLPESNDPNLVYRLYNRNTGVHFYTGNEVERDAVVELANFDYEGASYQSIDPLTGNPQPDPVYRFLNQDTGVHLYTISEVERGVVQEMDNFIFEGEAFYAYDPEIGSEIDSAIPIFRFFNNSTGAHFYTPSAVERDYIEDSLPNFQSEGIAYYAFPVRE